MELEKVHLQRESHDRAASLLQPRASIWLGYGSPRLEQTHRLPDRSWRTPRACCVLSTAASTLHLLPC